MLQVQNYVKLKDNNEHLSSMVSSLHMQLDEAEVEKRHLQCENKSLHGRLDDIEHSDKSSRISHRSSTMDRESMHGRSSRHGMDGADNFTVSYNTASLLRSDSSSATEHVVGEQVW